MRKMKKIASLMMALVMVMAMSVTAFAATQEVGTGEGSITITNAVEGETYTIYKMLDLSYNVTTESYSYTTTSDWAGFFTTDNGFTVANGYVTGWDANETITSQAELAKAALEYAEENNITETSSVVADDGGASFEKLDLGYYLVDTTLGTLCSLDSTDPDVSIQEKNSTEPTFDKTVDNQQNNTASIGDTVSYTITISNVENKSDVVVKDTLSDGLTLDPDSITVKVNETAVEVSDTTYSLDTTTENSFTITFVDSYLEDMANDIVITYSATINEKAVIGIEGNTNNAVLSYGNDQELTDKTKTTVYQFVLKKVDNKGNELTGATFTLKDRDNNVISVTKQDDGSYIVDPNGDDTITVGNTTIIGLAAGTYYLTEETAPTGYNKLADSITIVISETTDETTDAVTGYTITMGEETVTTVEVVNQAGSSLPSTGGIGTTIFYVVGTVLVLGAAVVLITRRRMSSEA